jgi:hypothetical protein
MAKMLGHLRDSGCNYGKHCTCNGWYRQKSFTRLTKRRERQQWKKEAVTF